MTASLPDHPDLDQLRRQAKELHHATRGGDPHAAERIHAWAPNRPAASVTLAVAQFVIAREHGFPSWPALHAAIGAARGRSATPERALLEACVNRRAGDVGRILAGTPEIARASVFTAAVAGDSDAVRTFLAADPTAATMLDDVSGWPALLFACYTTQPDPRDRSDAGGAVVVRLLLAAGADPNTHNGVWPTRPGYRSAVHGAVSTNKPDTLGLLLEAGAHADDRVSAQSAARFADRECLRLLLAAGVEIERTWVLQTTIEQHDPAGAALVLDALARTMGPDQASALATSALSETASLGRLPVIETLLRFGADPAGTTDDPPPLVAAVRAGHQGAARQLASLPGAGTIDVVDELIGACIRCDRPSVTRLLADHPGLVDRLDPTDRAAIIPAADLPSREPVRLMLEVGFNAGDRNDLGETALHAAAYHGRVDTVRLLLDSGADVDARDTQFDATPLAYATVGSGEQDGGGGDWVATVQTLLDAGAAHHDVWLAPPKAPSDPVADVLRRHGITPQPATADADGDSPTPEQSGVLADLAEALRTAYASRDLDLFGSLLHPEVRWGGGPQGCANRSEVLSWYADAISRDTFGVITDIEIAGTGMLATISFTRPARGTRAQPADVTYQVLRVRDATIIEIAGHPDLAAARAALTAG